MIHIKPGVSLASLKPQMVLLIAIADGVFAKRNVECIVTSADEGTHGRGSAHFTGFAVDLRTRTLEPGDRSQVAHEIRYAAGESYDIVLEGDHIHCEYQPKKGANQ